MVCRLFILGMQYILCIDDDVEDCHLLTESIHFHNPDIEVIFFTNGDAVIQYLRQHPGKKPSMIILDINLPGMNGIKTFLALKVVLGNDVHPAMFLTTTPRPADVEFAKQNGLLIHKKPSTMQGYKDLAIEILEIMGQTLPNRT